MGLGIISGLLVLIISLSISGAAHRSYKKATAHNIALVTLSNIDEVTRNFEVIAGYYDNFRLGYDYISSVGDLSLVSDSICDLFVDYLEGLDYFAINSSPQETFCTTFELWDYLDDIPLIRRIGNCYAYKDAFLEVYNNEQSTVKRLVAEAGLPGLPNKRAKLQAIMNSAEFHDYMTRSESKSNTYHKIIDVLVQYNNQNKLDMHVTDNDLQALVSPKKLATSIDENFIFIVGPDQ